MSKELGWLDKKEVKLLAGIVDDVIDFKNPFVEAFDGKFFQITIGKIDDILVEKIPDDWKNPIKPIINAAFENDWELVANLGSDFINTKVDIPGIDEETEGVVLNGLLQMIVGVITMKAKSQIAPPPDGPPDGSPPKP